jgi:hypothetical protein
MQAKVAEFSKHEDLTKVQLVSKEAAAINLR